jgi:thiamine pyrophosphokinase
MGGSMRIYKEFYQWKGNGKVFVKTPKYMEDSEGCVCYDMYTVFIRNRAYYLASKLSVASGSERVYTISAYRIDGDKLLDSVKLFKTKTESLNTIDVYVDLSKVVEPIDREEFISYDPGLKIISIPLVNEKDELTNKNLLYQLKGRYFEYIGIEQDKRNSTR